MVAIVQAAPRLAANFEPYGQLIRMLLPRAQNAAVYDVAGNSLWVADGQDDPDLHRLAVEAMNGTNGASLDIDGFARAFDGAVAYVFCLRGEHGHALASVALLMNESGEGRPFASVLKLLRPALECLQRDLAMRASLGAMTRDLSSRDRDLDLLLDASVDQADTTRDADELGRLVQAAVDHLGSAVGALIVPEKSLALVRPHRDPALAADGSVVTRTHRHLLTWAQLQQRTMVVNKVGMNDKLPPYKLLSAPVRNVSGRVIGFLALFNPAQGEDFGLRQTRMAELLARKVATILVTRFDAATGLQTRAAFEQAVATVLAGRESALPDSIVYADIDQLHVINENFGMHVGDEVLSKVADVVRRRVPLGALPARMSGDRFAVYLPALAVDEASKVAEDLRAAVAELSHQRPDGLLKVTISVGVAAVKAEEKQALSHAVATAEIACKAAKDRGRDRVEMYHDGDVSIVRRHAEVHVVAKLREAIATNRFRLHAQPILPLQAGPAEPRFEILLRLENEDGELEYPGKFLPAAERYQLIGDIDRWVVANTCRVLAANRSILDRRAARFTINLSGQSVTNLAVADFIAAELGSAKIPPDLICFELTETAALANLEKANAFMQRVRELGCTFALDDFGTGTSSLAHLKSLPVSMLKIDGSFVRDAMTNPRSDSLVKAVAQLARAMGITTVAEFVETDELRLRMANLGVDYGQGFAIGKPLPLQDVLQDLELYEMLAGETVVDPMATEGDLAVEIALLTG